MLLSNYIEENKKIIFALKQLTYKYISVDSILLILEHIKNNKDIELQFIVDIYMSNSYIQEKQIFTIQHLIDWLKIETNERNNIHKQAIVPFYENDIKIQINNIIQSRNDNIEKTIIINLENNIISFISEFPQNPINKVLLSVISHIHKDSL